MDPVFNPNEYKINTRINWNTVAIDYHDNWANKNIGPFRSTKELVRALEIKPDDFVLDIACGTGAITKEISHNLGNSAMLVGIDISRVALSIAKRSVKFQNIDFIEMDAENICIHTKFDKIVCQYGLMFFPDVNKVLKSIKNLLKIDATLAVAVHGTQIGVPYFSSIMKPILHYIPDIRPIGTPTVHRFGNPEDLQKTFNQAGFLDVKIKKFTFKYEAGTFDEYWQDYTHTTASSIWPKIQSCGIEIINAIKKDAMKYTEQYTKNDKIEFPWEVLIATVRI